MLLLHSCCKTREDRSEYLSPLQKDIINMYQAGDTIKMTENETDTLISFVTSSNISQLIEGAFCNKHWYDRGWVFFGNNMEASSISGNIQSRGEGAEDYAIIIISPEIYRGPKDNHEISINGTLYNNAYLFLSDDNDTLYISLTKGFLYFNLKDSRYTLID